MTRRLVSFALLVIVTFVSPQRAGASIFGDYWERLSGPGPFVGIGAFSFSLCREAKTERHVQDKEDTFFIVPEASGEGLVPDIPDSELGAAQAVNRVAALARLETELNRRRVTGGTTTGQAQDAPMAGDLVAELNTAFKGTGFQVDPTTEPAEILKRIRERRDLEKKRLTPRVQWDFNCRNASRRLHPVSLNIESTFAVALDNNLPDDPDQEGDGKTVYGFLNVWALDYNLNRAMAVGFGAGPLVLWGDRFGALIVPVVQPVRVTFRPLVMLANWYDDSEVRKRRLEFLQLRIAPNLLLRNLNAKDFGSLDPGTPYSEKTEWQWTASLVFDLSRLLSYKDKSAGTSPVSD